jgi:hypothetical protein
LYNSFVRKSNESVFDNEVQDFVLIKTEIKDDIMVVDENINGKFYQGNAAAYITWENLMKNCENLKKEIGSWLLDNGINESNIREDFKVMK